MVFVFRFKNGQPIEESKIERTVTFTHDRQILQLRKLHPNHKGKYTCIVSNEYGSFQHTIWVHVFGKNMHIIIVYHTIRLRITLIKETRFQ